MKYRESLKFNRWASYFLDARNKQTYCNGTQSALQVYNTTNYKSASVIGSENLIKLRHLSSVIVEQLGYGFADLMRIGLMKTIDGSYNDWDQFMIHLGYFEQEKHS